MANLSSTSSIVDYLTLQGKDSSYTARKKLYEDLGMATRLGDYTGSAQQNTNLLNSLRTQSSSSSSAPLYGMSTPSGSVTYDYKPPVTSPTGYNPTTGTPLANPNPTNSLNPSALSVIGLAPSLGQTTPQQTQPTGSSEPAVAPAPAPVAPAPVSAPAEPTAAGAVDTANNQQAFSATDALAALGMGANNIPTADEALKKVMDSPAYQLYLESIGLKTKAQQAGAETQKQALDEAAATKANEINQTYGQRGLYFSGMRPDDLRKLSESLATSKLGVDRELAVNLLENDINVRDRIFTDVEKIISDAVNESGKARSEAIDQINKLGYAVVDGQVLPIPQKTDFSSIRSVQNGLYDVATGKWIVEPKQGADALTAYQESQTFLTVTNKYQADQIINQAVNGNTVTQIADLVIANPNQATSQLASLYLLVKNLDPTSAVREGELALANQTQSYLQKFQTSLTRISEGQVISPAAATELAKATKQIAQAWNNTAALRQQQYQSQANTLGIGTKFSNYLGGYKSNFQVGTQETTNAGSTASNPMGI